MFTINKLLVEYDDIMIGKRDSFSDSYFSKESVASSNNALTVMRYAFKHYLRWSKEAVAEKLDTALMKKLHLLGLMKFIDYPIEYDKDKDYFYLANLVFSRTRLTLRDRTIHIYERILYSGSVVKTKI